MILLLSSMGGNRADYSCLPSEGIFYSFLGFHRSLEGLELLQASDACITSVAADSVSAFSHHRSLYDRRQASFHVSKIHLIVLNINK